MYMLLPDCDFWVEMLSVVTIVLLILRLFSLPQSLVNRISYVLVRFLLQASKVRFTVGSQVWVEDADVAWIDGLVEEVQGDELVINCSSGKKVSY
jgi:hypothetical protein